MKTTLMKMTDAYEHQSFYNSIEDLIILDCRHIEGTRCYLDDIAKEQLLDLMEAAPSNGIHFIDSGNYHYLSLLWLCKINTDFNLILFDHHPDNQPPSFGQITSCGGWVLEATESLAHLKEVFTYGVGQAPSISNIPTDLPIYISIDKDVLDEKFAITDWDQGDMTLESMIKIISELTDKRKLIGADICGDSGEDPLKGSCVNSQTNQTLFDILSRKF